MTYAFWFSVVYFFLVPSCIAFIVYLDLNGLKYASWAQWCKHFREEWAKLRYVFPKARVVR